MVDLFWKTAFTYIEDHDCLFSPPYSHMAVCSLSYVVEKKLQNGFAFLLLESFDMPHVLKVFSMSLYGT